MNNLAKDINDFFTLFFGLTTMFILFLITIAFWFAPVFLALWIETFNNSGIAIAIMLIMYCIYYVVARKLGLVERYLGVLNG